MKGWVDGQPVELPILQPRSVFNPRVLLPSKELCPFFYHS